MAVNNVSRFSETENVQARTALVTMNNRTAVDLIRLDPGLRGSLAEIDDE